MKTIKTIYLIIILCLLSIAAYAQKKQITILHTNDTHSQIFPLSVNLADTMIAGRGGFVRRLTLLRQERKKDPELLLFDSGDFSQGSPYYTLFKGEVEVELMNRMHYDAGTIGNHEFDFGVENMALLFKKINFPIVCANYDFQGTLLEGLVKPYVIIKRKGLKIGVFGISTYLDGLVDKKNQGGVKFLDPVKSAQNAIDKLKAQKCDYIICLSHLGYNIEGISDEELVSQTTGIDLVLGGHSHTFLKEIAYEKDKSGKLVPIDQNGKSGIFIGKMVVDFSKK